MTRATLGVLLSLVLAGAATASASVDTLYLTPDRLQPGDSIPLWSYWVFQEGDDLAWADPAFPDDGWQPQTIATGEQPGGWDWLGGVCSAGPLPSSTKWAWRVAAQLGIIATGSEAAWVG